MEELYLEQERQVVELNYPYSVLYSLLKAKQKDLLKMINTSPHIHILPYTGKSLIEMVEINHKLEKIRWNSVKIPPEIMYSLRLLLNYKPAIMKTLKRHLL